MTDYIQINKLDNVAVALRPLAAGETVTQGGTAFTLAEAIPQGHKFALQPLAAGENVIKYGSPIGHTTAAAAAGAWLHTHNLQTNLGDLLEYTYQPTAAPAVAGKVPAGAAPERFFRGYRRADGRAGVRNEIWIIPTVGCVNNVATAIERRAQDLLVPGVDEIIAFPHPYGCSQMGGDQENTRRILADLINHPNAGGVLVLGLGCENSNIEVLKSYLGDYDDQRVKFLVAQDSEDEIGDACALVAELVTQAAACKREPISCRELVIGMKCGGSDGLSGITANPTVGAFSDRLTDLGGTTILTEVPEMFGAETLLMNRAKDEATFQKIVRLINDFKNYFTSHHQTIYENPSPGNKQGGISTLEDKSLGCTQKSGTAVVTDVLAYGEKVRTAGLNLLSAPGNDLVAATALAAAGAQIVLFTTGRGTPFAAPVPTVKIATNSALYQKKRNWIDFNCGSLVEDASLDELADRLFDFCIRIASGEPVRSELAGYHDMAIFKTGVTL